MRSYFGRLLAVLAVSMSVAAPLAAQTTGSIQGRVTDAETGSALSGAQVSIRVGLSSTTGGLTDENGQYRVTGLRPGHYTVVVQMTGYSDVTRQGVEVPSGGAATVNAAMQTKAYSLNPVVVTASKKPEKLTEAPAAVAVVDIQAVQLRPAVSPVDHLRSIPGIDVIQQGVQGANVVTRGFNNIFSTTLHTLTDYRIASIPSLRANLMHFIPSTNEDLERVEVVLGPGAALYGPNTANGVVHMITRSPLDYQGTTATIAGGDRQTLMGSFRTAHLLGEDFGVKLSGQYMQAQEYKFTDIDEYNARLRALPFDPNTKIGLRDYDIQRYAFDARADWRINPEWTTVFSGGHTVAASGIELTGVGAGQTKDWTYSYLQARTNYKRLFAQAYVNMSDAGQTYLIRNGLQVADNSKFFVGQVQHGFDLGASSSFTYGADLLFTRPDTKGKIHGRNEADDNTNEFGAYLQSQSDLSSKFEFVAAGRVDYHSRLDHAVFSPRAALVYKPVDNQNFRFTFNRAFTTPVSFNLYLDLDAGPAPGAVGDIFGYRIRAMGTEPNGFHLINDDGTLAGIRSPFTDAVFGQPDNTLLDPSVANMWKLYLGALAGLGRITPQQQQALAQLNPPDGAITVNALNLQTLRLAPVSRQTVRNVPKARESLSNTFEVGYKGILGERILLNADAWYERRTKLGSPLTPVSPLLFLDSLGIYNTVYQGLKAAGQSDAQAAGTATALAAGAKSIPVATVSSAEVDAGGADVLATYLNFGDLDVFGGDVNVTALLTDHWSTTLGVALVNKDYFEVEGSFVGLNAPKTKGSAALNYRNEAQGINGEVRARFNSEFPVYSAPYNATACIGGGQSFDVPLAGKPDPCVESATLVDLTLGYRFRLIPGASVQLSVQNILDEKHASFVRVPEIGRYSLLRLRYEF